MIYIDGGRLSVLCCYIINIQPGEKGYSDTFVKNNADLWIIIYIGI